MRLNANSGFVRVSSSISPCAVWDLAACPIPSGCWSHTSQPGEPVPLAARALALSRTGNASRACPNKTPVPGVSREKMKICLHHVST